MDLLQDGNASFSTGDYVSASYYYQRMMESDQWPSFPNRVDVLRKLAMIEESQAEFELAAHHYRQLIDLLPSANDLRAMTLRHYYLQHYAENLERIGLYEKAASILWEIIRQSDSANQQNVLRLLMENYEYQTLTDEQIENVRHRIIPQHVDELGWEFADLLRKQGRTQESIDLFEKLWPENPLRAYEYAGQLLDLYRSADQLEALLGRIREAQGSDGEAAGAYVLLEVSLLEEDGRGEEALNRLEDYIAETVGMDRADFAGDLLLSLPGRLIDRWIDLTVRFRGAEPAVQMLDHLLKQIPMDLNRRKKLSNLLVEEGRSQDAVRLWRQWAHDQSNAPTAVLNAAQEIFTLGDVDSAKALIDQLKETLPPPLTWRQGQASLQYGDYSGAVAAFQIAVASGGIDPSMISSVIFQYAETQSDLRPLISNFVNEASGASFNSIPEWIKTPLFQIGVQPAYRNQLQPLIDADEQGVWKYHFAAEAIRFGDQDWAASLLEAIPEDSFYRTIADQMYAKILRQNPSIIAQRQAADLMLPSIQTVLSTTESVQLNSVSLQRLLTYADLRLNGYQSNEALKAIRVIESASSTLEHPLSSDDASRLLFYRGRAYAEAASFGPAIQWLESVCVSPYEESAQLLLARIYIAQRESEIAKTLLDEIAENPRYWRKSNDALTLLAALEPLVGDSLQLFCDAMMYELQGRFSSAIPVLRQLAVEHYGSDVEEWARYYIGQLKYQSGDLDGAREEWRRLLVDVDHPVIQGMTHLDLLKLNPSSSADIADMTEYQEIMMELPNTLFSDLARLQMQWKFGKEQP